MSSNTGSEVVTTFVSPHIEFGIGFPWKSIGVAFEAAPGAYLTEDAGAACSVTFPVGSIVPAVPGPRSNDRDSCNATGSVLVIRI